MAKSDRGDNTGHCGRGRRMVAVTANTNTEPEHSPTTRSGQKAIIGHQITGQIMARKPLKNYFDDPPKSHHSGIVQDRLNSDQEIRNAAVAPAPAASLTAQDYRNALPSNPELERDELQTVVSTSMPGMIEDEAANEIADVSDVQAPTLRRTVRDIIEGAELIPFEHNTSQTRQIAEDQYQTAQERHEANMKRERDLMRQGALQQSIMALADLFVLNRKKNEPSAVGNRYGIRFSQEAAQRLEAQKILHEKDLQAHYNRMFQIAAREQQVDDQNIALANEIVREDLINRHREELEALRESLQGQITDRMQDFHFNAALRSITAGDIEGAYEHMRRAGIDWDLETGRIRGIQQPQQQEPELSPFDQDMLLVMQRDHQQLVTEIAALQRQVEAAGQAFGPDHPTRQRLQSLIEQRNHLEQNELLRRHLVRERAGQIRREQQEQQRRQRIEDANGQSEEMRSRLITQNFADDEELYAGIGEYMLLLADAGKSPEAIDEAARAIFRGNKSRRIVQSFAGQARHIRTTDAQEFQRQIQPFVLLHVQQLIDIGISEQNAFQIMQSSMRNARPDIFPTR